MKVDKTLIYDAFGEDIGSGEHIAAAVRLKNSIDDNVAFAVDRQQKPDKRTAAKVCCRADRTLVTALAWVIIVGSALATPISVISCLMVLVGSYGTSSADPIGGLIVVGGPFAFLLAGIGLRRRKRWAHYLMLAALFALLAYNVYGILRGPSPASSYVSADGVPTTVLASEAPYSLPLIAICICVLILLLAPNVRSEFGISRGTNFPTER